MDRGEMNVGKLWEGTKSKITSVMGGVFENECIYHGGVLNVVRSGIMIRTDFCEYPNDLLSLFPDSVTYVSVNAVA